MKKKILLDLDVITVALWDRNKEAMEFLERVKKNEFDLYTPHTLLELIDKWRHDKLKNEIKRFYELYSRQIISLQNIVEEGRRKNLNIENTTKILLDEDIKEEDAALIVIASLFGLDYLVTYNRKHLLNKVNTINEILSKNEFEKIEIKAPSAF